ncbi:hypothetical protein DOTSEDRAFT_83104 [Dothistroma septosporum NZE10]|uniref:Uncharacterized protein n=1 Tax=Dothistroma septosporum (strain NZE10 / CBS 128990) TaxID=675120 RepID=M2WK48_DOTSN|nr:hypothetical protein DOTSEDRAFT_83104 [Dothistroma septosporum NZE10]
MAPISRLWYCPAPATGLCILWPRRLRLSFSTSACRSRMGSDRLWRKQQEWGQEMASSVQCARPGGSGTERQGRILDAACAALGILVYEGHARFCRVEVNGVWARHGSLLERSNTSD